MGSSKRSSADHQAILASLKAKQSARQRKRNILVYGGFGLLLVVMAVAVNVTGSIQDKNAADEAAKRPIEGIRAYTGLARNHVQDTVSYPHDPGAGGDHSAIWTNCGIYTEPISEERAVHSLEHGAVWLTYNPSLPPAGINKLSALAKHKLCSPQPGQRPGSFRHRHGMGNPAGPAGCRRFPYPRLHQFLRPVAECTGARCSVHQRSRRMKSHATALNPGAPGTLGAVE